MMGHGMAKNLLSKGYPLTFKGNRNRAKLADPIAAGAKEAASNAVGAHASDMVFICVTGAQRVEEIVYGRAGSDSCCQGSSPVGQPNQLSLCHSDRWGSCGRQVPPRFFM